MSLCLTEEIASVAQQVTGRTGSLFGTELALRQDQLAHRLQGRRLLVVGGAGSIGSATIEALLRWQPAELALIDPNENNGVELLRHIRSAPEPCTCEISIQPLALGTALAEAWLAAQQPFDLVLNFAAIKHVRSERDSWSLLRMMETNLLAGDQLLAACRRHGHGHQGVFFVSTDKAANPVNLMGASKRLMEMLLWAHCAPAAPASLVHGGSAPPLRQVTTTRFANVAFSDGSLPWGFLQRLAKQQPLAAPKHIRRFLVSPREAGELCLLAACATPHRHILVPDLDPATDTCTFPEIAHALLKHRGLDVATCSSEEQARDHMYHWRPGKPWPLLLTEPDTMGEKPCEEFVGAGETATGDGWHGLAIIAAQQQPDVDLLQSLFTTMHAWVQGQEPALDKDRIIEAFATVVPNLHHRSATASLDGRM